MIAPARIWKRASPTTPMKPRDLSAKWS